jgi:hypothetical protein
MFYAISRKEAGIKWEEWKGERALSILHSHLHQLLYPRTEDTKGSKKDLSSDSNFAILGLDLG